MYRQKESGSDILAMSMTSRFNFDKQLLADPQGRESVVLETGVRRPC